MSDQENTSKGCCCSAFCKCCGPTPADAAPPASDAKTCDTGGCPVEKPAQPDSGPGCGCG